MSNVEGPTSIVLLHGVLNGTESGRNPPGEGECIDYLRSRQRCEQLAAEQAQTEHARQLHRELAHHYSRKIQQRGS